MNVKKGKIKLKNIEVQKCIGLEPPNLPKYLSTLINKANRFSKATRPENVGQLSDLIKEFPGKSVSEWESWYIERYPNAIKDATEKIMTMLKSFRDTLDEVSLDVVELWVRDLVIGKTFAGLHFQEAILKKIAKIKGMTYRLATKKEESKGIDGYIGNTPISIKPHTYKEEKELMESIDAKIVYYEKQDDGIEVDFKEVVG